MIVFDDAAAIVAATCACVFSAVGVLGNLVTIVALALNPKLRSHATTAFVLSLCISDLLFCSVSLPLTAVRYINKVSVRCGGGRGGRNGVAVGAVRRRVQVS